MARTKSTKSMSQAAETANRDATLLDAVELLKQDHDTVDALFKQFEAAKESKNKNKKAQLTAQICKELTIHATIEEEIFYPAARAALGEEGSDLLDEAEVEHQGAKDLIAQLSDMSPGDELFDAKVTVLAEYIRHHVKEEETELFPKMEKSEADLDQLGKDLLTRKTELQTELEAEEVS